VKKKAFLLLDKEQFPIVAGYMRKAAFDKMAFEWAYYTTLSKTFKQNLRHLFVVLDFGGRVEDAPLIYAIDFMQDLFKRDKSPRQVSPIALPVSVIPKQFERDLYIPAENDRRSTVLDPDRYEFLIYRLLRNALEAGDVFVQKSNESRVKTDEEQHVWNECSRLIANAVIYYNTLLLSRVNEKKLAVGDEEAIELMRRISPIAWQHINMLGTFEFTPSTSGLDIDALAALYLDPTNWLNTLKTEAELAPTRFQKRRQKSKNRRLDED